MDMIDCGSTGARLPEVVLVTHDMSTAELTN